MKTIVKKVNDIIHDKEAIDEAGEILKSGGLVAFPTETVYGLGADALNEEAAAKIYEAKGRPSDNPLIIHIAKLEDLGKIVTEIPEKAEALARTFWPGPLTLILNKASAVPYGTTGGLETVAVRMPDWDIARAVIEAGGGYIAAPSANTSGKPSPTNAARVLEDMAGKIEMIVDGGEVSIGLESTIVDLTVEPPQILRPGAITKSMLKNTIGEVIDGGKEIGTQSGPKAPGMKYKHYAPRGQLVIIKGEPGAVAEKINALAREKQAQGFTVGVLATTESAYLYPDEQVRIIGTRQDDASIAKGLYESLRSFDDMGVDYIYSEAFAEKGMGKAIMNRLVKAAGHAIINLTKEDK
ncbi:L-threonylcarbamoyladenylate synthase [Lachnospiraceae bacterium PF1-21]